MSVVNRLSSPGFDEETRTYLQQRVRLLAGAVTIITGTLAAAFLAIGLRASQTDSSLFDPQGNEAAGQDADAEAEAEAGTDPT